MITCLTLQCIVISMDVNIRSVHCVSNFSLSQYLLLQTVNFTDIVLSSLTITLTNGFTFFNLVFTLSPFLFFIFSVAMMTSLCNFYQFGKENFFSAGLYLCLTR